MKTFLTTTLLLGVATFAAEAGSAQSCARASEELRAAQATLADAMRRADESGAAYHGCMERNRQDGRACSAARKAADAALAQKRHARAVYDTAADNKRRSCK